MTEIIARVLLFICLSSSIAWAQAIYDPESGVVEIPELRVLGEPAVFSVKMQHAQGGNFEVSGISSTRPTIKLVSDLSYDNSWQTGFAEYTDANCETDNCEMAGEYREMPRGFGDGRQGLFMQSNNHSDDLFMYAKKQLGGLKPNTSYHVRVEAFIASEFCYGMIGIGGSPSESNYVHIGVSQNEPFSLDDEYHTMNIEKGNQAQSGGLLEMVGNLGVECSDPDPYPDHYFPKTLVSFTGMDVTSDDNGKAWIIIGNDSGFEGLTKFYLYQMIASFTEK